MHGPVRPVHNALFQHMYLESGDPIRHVGGQVHKLAI